MAVLLRFGRRLKLFGDNDPISRMTVPQLRQYEAAISCWPDTDMKRRRQREVLSEIEWRNASHSEKT